MEQIALVRDVKAADQLPENIQLDFALVSLWTRSQRDQPETATMRFVFRGPDGKDIGKQEYLLNLSDHVRHRVLSRLNGLAFKGFGRYEFVVQMLSDTGRWQKVAVVPLEVDLAISDVTVQ
jgi:hypothetical protein